MACAEGDQDPLARVGPDRPVDLPVVLDVGAARAGFDGVVQFPTEPEQHLPLLREPEHTGVLDDVLLPQPPIDPLPPIWGDLRAEYFRSEGPRSRFDLVQPSDRAVQVAVVGHGHDADLGLLRDRLGPVSGIHAPVFWDADQG